MIRSFCSVYHLLQLKSDNSACMCIICDQSVQWNSIFVTAGGTKRDNYCHRRLSVRLSVCPYVCNVDVLWSYMRLSVLLRSCYHRCIKSFFGYDRLYSVTAILLDLQLPSFDTNYKFSFNMQLTCGGNDVVRYLVGIGLWCVYVLFLLFFYHCFICLLYTSPSPRD